MSVSCRVGDEAIRSKVLFGKYVVKWCMYLLIGFPIVNYALQWPMLHAIGMLHSIGLIWDKVILLLMVGIALFRYLTGYRPAIFAWSRLAGWYIIYCAGLMIAGYVSSAPVAVDGFSMDVEYMMFGILLPFIVDTEDIPKFMYGIVAVSMLLSIDGVYQYVTKVPNPTAWADVGGNVRTRVFSVFGSPAEFAANMEMAIPLLLAAVFVDRNQIRKWIYICGGLCCAATLLFTYSRGAWLALGIAVLVVAIVYERRFMMILVLFILIVFFLPPVHHRLMDLLNPVYLIKSSQGGRILLWQKAFDAMSTNPLLGSGMGRYGGAIASAYHYSVYSDNYYAKILGESGIVGLVLFLGIHVSILIELIRTVVLRAKGKERYLALAGLAGTISIISHNMVENLYEYAPTVLLYYLVVGLFLLWGRTLDHPELNRHDVSSRLIHRERTE